MPKRIWKSCLLPNNAILDAKAMNLRSVWEHSDHPRHVSYFAKILLLTRQNLGCHRYLRPCICIRTRMFVVTPVIRKQACVNSCRLATYLVELGWVYPKKNKELLHLHIARCISVDAEEQVVHLLDLFTTTFLSIYRVYSRVCMCCSFTSNSDKATKSIVFCTSAS